MQLSVKDVMRPTIAPRKMTSLRKYSMFEIAALGTTDLLMNVDTASRIASMTVPLGMGLGQACNLT